MCGGKVDTSGQERAAREQAAAIREQTARQQAAANETTRQAAQQVALEAQRSQVAAQIAETTAAAKPEAVKVELDEAAVNDTPTRKRAKFQLASDPSASIRI